MCLLHLSEDSRSVTNGLGWPPTVAIQIPSASVHIGRLMLVRRAVLITHDSRSDHSKVFFRKSPKQLKNNATFTCSFPPPRIRETKSLLKRSNTKCSRVVHSDFNANLGRHSTKH